VAVGDLSFRVSAVLEREMEIVRAQLKRNGIVQFHGHARFRDPHAIEIAGQDGVAQVLRAEHVLIACGTRPAHNPTVPIDGRRVLDSDPAARHADAAARAHRRRRRRDRARVRLDAHRARHRR
jgi:NAD(P) transhydrogenase